MNRCRGIFCFTEGKTLHKEEKAEFGKKCKTDEIRRNRAKRTVSGEKITKYEEIGLEERDPAEI